MLPKPVRAADENRFVIVDVPAQPRSSYTRWEGSWWRDGDVVECHSEEHDERAQWHGHLDADASGWAAPRHWPAFLHGDGSPAWYDTLDDELSALFDHPVITHHDEVHDSDLLAHAREHAPSLSEHARRHRAHHALLQGLRAAADGMRPTAFAWTTPTGERVTRWRAEVDPAHEVDLVERLVEHGAVVGQLLAVGDEPRTLTLDLPGGRVRYCPRDRVGTEHLPHWRHEAVLALDPDAYGQEHWAGSERAWAASEWLVCEERLHAEPHAPRIHHYSPDHYQHPRLLEGGDVPRVETDQRDWRGPFDRHVRVATDDDLRGSFEHDASMRWISPVAWHEWTAQRAVLERLSRRTVVVRLLADEPLNEWSDDDRCTDALHEWFSRHHLPRSEREVLADLDGHWWRMRVVGEERLLIGERQTGPMSRRGWLVADEPLERLASRLGWPGAPTGTCRRRDPVRPLVVTDPTVFLDVHRTLDALLSDLSEHAAILSEHQRRWYGPAEEVDGHAQAIAGGRLCPEQLYALGLDDLLVLRHRPPRGEGAFLLRPSVLLDARLVALPRVRSLSPWAFQQVAERAGCASGCLLNPMDDASRRRLLRPSDGAYGLRGRIEAGLIEAFVCPRPDDLPDHARELLLAHGIEVRPAPGVPDGRDGVVPVPLWNERAAEARAAARLARRRARDARRKRVARAAGRATTAPAC